MQLRNAVQRQWRRDLTLFFSFAVALVCAGLAYRSYPGWMLVSGVVDGHEGRARWALRRQTEPDRFEVKGKSLLMVAATRGDDRMVELLLDYGADPNHSTFLTDSAVVGAVEGVT